MIDSDHLDQHIAVIGKHSAQTLVTDHLGSVLNGELTTNSKSYRLFGEVLKDLPTIERHQSSLHFGHAGRLHE